MHEIIRDVKYAIRPLNTNHVLVGMPKWTRENRKKPRGRLDEVRDIIAGPRNPVARTVSIPIETGGAGPTKAADSAWTLAGIHNRSFELWWDKDESRLQFALVSGAEDMESFASAFEALHPDASLGRLDVTVPEWVDYTSKYRVFDAGLMHGQYASILRSVDNNGILGHMAHAIQLARHGWVQVVFRQYEFGSFLSEHQNRMRRLHDKIKEGNHTEWYEGIVTKSRPRDHPELRGEFVDSYQDLMAQAAEKSAGQNIVVSVRGLIEDDPNRGSEHDTISTLPVWGIQSRYDHLMTFRYDYTRFYSDSKKSRIKMPESTFWRRVYDQRISIFASRSIPNPKPFLGPAMSEYTGKKWPGFRGYHIRRPMPFFILNSREMSLFSGIPEPMTPNIDITRGANLPSRPSEKEGAGIGFFDGSDDYRWDKTTDGAAQK